MTNNKKCCACLVTLVVALIIFFQTNVLTIMIFELKGNTKQEEQITKEVVQETKNIANEWKLNIPKINLSYTIEEGTTQEIIDNGIGHFADTAYLDGNIGLVAGCYGYNKNIFQNLDKLQENDVILYNYKGKQQIYQVMKNIIIDEKDWTHLNNTNENKITLITGVVNAPEQRRCVQAKQIEEE